MGYTFPSIGGGVTDLRLLLPLQTIVLYKIDETMLSDIRLKTAQD